MLPNGLKPDIELKYDGQIYLLDVGFSNRPEGYRKGKINKYQHLTSAIVQPIIFGKNFTIHKDSLQFLSKFKEIKLSELYTEMGKLLAIHFSKCRAKITEVLTEKNSKKQMKM